MNVLCNYGTLSDDNRDINDIICLYVMAPPPMQARVEYNFI